MKYHRSRYILSYIVIVSARIQFKLNESKSNKIYYESSNYYVDAVFQLLKQNKNKGIELEGIL